MKTLLSGVEAGRTHFAACLPIAKMFSCAVYFQDTVYTVKRVYEQGEFKKTSLFIRESEPMPSRGFLTCLLTSFMIKAILFHHVSRFLSLFWG